MKTGHSFNPHRVPTIKSKASPYEIARETVHVTKDGKVIKLGRQ